MKSIRQALDDAFAKHIRTGEKSSNIEDRTGDPVVTRQFEFDGQSVILNVARPDGSIMSDDEASAKYLRDRSSMNPRSGGMT